MSIFSRFLPKRKPPEVKNNIPKEKANIKKTFGVYCHSHHGTTGEKLCPKCTALLATVMTRMNRCRYGITKPICDKCEFTGECFGHQQAREFLKIMQSGSKKMYLKHPVMAVKHKLSGMGVDYARYEQQKKRDAKAKAQERAAKGRSKERKERK